MQKQAQKALVAMMAGFSGLTCGFVIWAISHAIFFETILSQRRAMNPIIAATTVCDDCLIWSVHTFLTMLLGALASAVAIYKLANRALPSRT